MHTVWRLALKDLRCEWRSRAALSAVATFAVGTLLVFAFAFELEKLPPERLVPGVLWATVLFSALITLNRAFLIEEPNDVWLAIVTSPVDRSTVFWGKVVSAAIFLGLLQAVIVAILMAWFGVSAGHAAALFGLALLGDLGLVSAGLLLASMAVRSRAREAVLPVLLLPVAVPWLISGVKASSAVLQSLPFSEYSGWIQMMAAFDVVFMAAGWVLFEYTVED